MLVLLLLCVQICPSALTISLCYLPRIIHAPFTHNFEIRSDEGMLTACLFTCHSHTGRAHVCTQAPYRLQCTDDQKHHADIGCTSSSSATLKGPQEPRSKAPGRRAGRPRPQRARQPTRLHTAGRSVGTNVPPEVACTIVTRHAGHDHTILKALGCMARAPHLPM